ncbi:MAG: hypothetical protein KIT09_08850 [Bryobacteraceae bacterium]|nr:hypothetical protein [Bryobacteraceae bacterium]
MTPTSEIYLDPSVACPLQRTFDWEYFIETERELWAFFPETIGRRVNLLQLGLTAVLYAEAAPSSAPLGPDETYVLLPCEDRCLRPVRMKAVRRLTLEEFRRCHLTSVKMIGHLDGAAEAYITLGQAILGREVIEEAALRATTQSDGRD